MLELIITALVIYQFYFWYNMMYVVPKHQSYFIKIPFTKHVWQITKLD